MNAMVNRPKTERLIGLEVLRFLAAVGVLVWHYQHFLFVGPYQSPVAWNRLPFYWLLAPFYTYGYQGVELFWCISGFIFTWKYGGIIGQRGLSFGRFVWLRFSRLYPLHLAMLLAVAGLQSIYIARHGMAFVYLFNDLRHFVLSLFFANWWGFQLGESFNGPSWSVSAEVLIYLGFFWITRWIGAGRTADMVGLAFFPVAAWAAKAAFGIKLSFTGAGTFFYLGAWVCHLYGWIVLLRPATRRRIAGFCLLTVLVSALLTWRHILAIAGASLVLFPAAILLVQLVVRPVSMRVAGVLTGLGNLTYASYMIHFPMQLAAMLILGETVPLLVYHAAFLLAYLCGVLATAFGVFRFVERPAQDALRRLLPPRRPDV